MRTLLYSSVLLWAVACSGPKKDETGTSESIQALNDSVTKKSETTEKPQDVAVQVPVDITDFSAYPLITLPLRLSPYDSSGVRYSNKEVRAIFATTPATSSFRLIGLLPDTTTHYAIVWVGVGEAREPRAFITMVKKDTREIVYRAFLDGYAQPDPDCKAEVYSGSVYVDADWKVTAEVYSATCTDESEEATVTSHIGKTGIEDLYKDVNPKD